MVTLETLKARIAKELEHGRVDIAPLVSSYSPHDIEAGQLLGACAVEKLTTIYSCIRSFLTTTYGVLRCPKAFCDASS